MSTRQIILFLSCIFLISCHNDIIINEPHSMPMPPNTMPIPIEESAWITAQGRGSSQKLAISDAWRQAMDQYAQDNLDSAYYQRNRDQITTYIVENWRSYVIGDPETPEIQQRFNNRRVTILAHIKGKILYDIQRNIH